MSVTPAGRLNVTSAAIAACLGLVASTPALAQQAVQWRVQDGGNGHWYTTLRDQAGLNYESWSSRATSIGGQLLTGCAAEFDFAVASTDALNPQGWVSWGNHRVGPWIGLRLVGGAWRWIDNAGCSFDRWDTPDSQPDSSGEDAVLLYSTSPIPAALCHDITSAWLAKSAIIEWSADCDGDGIVDYGQILDGSFADVNSNGVPDSCELPVQWRIEDGGNGHWYQVRLNPGGETWFQCRDRALADGGHLATATSSAENLFIFDLASQTYGAFNSNTIQAGPFLGGYQPIGAGEPAAGWQWVTGEPWGFAPWAGGQPDNDGGCGQAPGDRTGEHYLQFIYASSNWNDMSAAATCFGGSKPSFVVEWSADCNEDGIVDYGQILDGTFADTNANSVPDCCDAGVSCDPCPGDLNDSHAVDAEDLAYILFAWGTDGGKTPEADINRDGAVDANDLSTVLGSWGACP
jgi:hypothetical protein